MKPLKSRRATALAAPLLAASLALLTSACVGSLDDEGSGPETCELSVSYTPDPAEASLVRPIRAIATASRYDGVLTYTWTVRHGGQPVAITPANSDSSMIEFPVGDPGIYDIELDAPGCYDYRRALNVQAPGAESRAFRLRVTPSGGTPQERLVNIPVGADRSYGTLLLERPLDATGTVRAGATGVASYLRFSRPGGGVVAERSSDGEGRFSAQLQPGLHEVLVVPTDDRAPFRLAAWDPFSELIEGPAGVVVTGEVFDPSGAPLAGALVSLKVAGLPSTVAVTGSQGTFAVSVQPGDPVELTVVPPAGSGLPRLLGTASGAAAQQVLTEPQAIRYRTDLARRDVGGLLLRRQGVAAAAATAVFVGELAVAGSANGGALALRGAVRIAALAGADGRLPATQVPAAALSAVVQPAGGGVAVLPFDATSAPPGSLDAPAMQQASGAVVTSAGPAAPGAIVELVPQGALALAGVPATTAVAGAAGAFSAPIAAGGRYRAQLWDPQHRGGPVSVAVEAPGSLGSIALAPGWRLVGNVFSGLFGSPSRGAAVELYCHTCSAAARQRVLGTVVTDDLGGFTLLVPSALE